MSGGLTVLLVDLIWFEIPMLSFVSVLFSAVFILNSVLLSFAFFFFSFLLLHFQLGEAAYCLFFSFLCLSIGSSVYVLSF